MRTRLTVATALVACALSAAAPALAGGPGPAGRAPRPPRALHPATSSGGDPGTPVTALPRYPRRRATTSDQVTWQVAPGVTYERWTRTDRRGPVVAHLLTVDPTTPGLQLDYASPGTVRQVARVRRILAVDGAVAGVNGDFYDIGHTGAPLGLGKDRQLGLLHGREDGWNHAFFIDRSGVPGIGDLPVAARLVRRPALHVTNLNSPFVAPGGIGIYTPAFGRTAGYLTTQGQHRRVREVRVRDGRVVSNRARLGRGQAIPGLVLVGRGDAADQLRRRLPVGSRVRARWSLAGRPQMAISGNQVLVRDGVAQPVDDRTLAPRTAVGIDRDTGDVLLLVVDGRSTASRGYTQRELADLMVSLGADEALNLDGGGSSTMVGRDQQGATQVLNTPSDGFERRVSDALEVTYTAPAAARATR